MNREDRDKIYEKTSKILCKTRTLPTATNMAVIMALRQVLELIDSMVEENPLNEFEKELKNIIESCGGKITNPNKDEVNAFIRCKAATLRRIWRNEENKEDSGGITYEKFIHDVADAIPKREIGWKPSVEQLKVMGEAVLYFGESWVSRKHQILQSLYDDLRKM